MAEHLDDIAVDLFASAMKQKLARKRAEGRGGWSDPNVCTVADLHRWMTEHIEKGDPVDVANFAMMIWHRTSFERLNGGTDGDSLKACLLSILKG